MFIKKIMAVGFLLALLILPSMSAEAAKPIVAVLPFNDQSPRKGSADNQAALENAMDYVTTALGHTNKFQMLTRTDIAPILDSIKFDHSGLVDPATAAQYGKMIGAQYIVVGTVTGLGSKGRDMLAHLSLRMIKVETAEIYLSGRGKGKSKGDPIDALENAAKDALNGEMGMLTMMRNSGK